MSTSHIFNVEQLHFPPPSHPEVIHLPGDDYLPGPALFPGELIAGYHAHFSQYTAESWAEYVLGETRKLPKGRVAFACSGEPPRSSSRASSSIDLTHRATQVRTPATLEAATGSDPRTASSLSLAHLSRLRVALRSRRHAHTSKTIFLPRACDPLG